MIKMSSISGGQEIRLDCKVVRWCGFMGVWVRLLSIKILFCNFYSMLCVIKFILFKGSS
jgi:hypothetical protein